MKKGNRKYSIVLIYLVCSILMVSFKVVPGDDWLQYTSWVILAFFGGNVGEWISKKGLK